MSVAPTGGTGYAGTMVANPVQWQHYAGGLDYPASKEDLIRRAQEQGADTETLQALRSLPVAQFESPAEVDEALGRAV